MKSVQWIKSGVFVSVAALTLAACNDSDDDDDDNGGSGSSAMSEIRVLHASPDAPAVDVALDSTVAIMDLDYGESSGFTTVNSGDYQTEVFGILADGSNSDAVIDATLTFDDDERYTVVAVDTLGNGAITAKVFEDDGMLSDSSMVRVQVAHLSEGVPEVYVHVTAPGATLSENTALGSISYTSGSDLLGPVEVDAGDYQIQVSTDAAGSSVAFDSGTVTLAAGSDLFIGAIPNATDIGSSPVSLAVLDGSGAAVLYDVANNDAALRAVHAVSDVDAVELGVAADAGAGDDVSSFDFGPLDLAEILDHVEVAAGTYDIGIDAADNDASDILFDGADLLSGMSYTGIAVGTAAVDSGTDIPLEISVYEDDRRGLATAAKVRIIHASTAAGDVDLYATADAIDGDYTGLTPAFTDVPYKASTGFFQLDPGTYHFTAALAGTETTGLASGAVTLEAGDILTIIARDLDSDMSETGDPVIKAILLTD